MLDKSGKTYTRETLAQQCIVVDILTGVISPLDDGDLLISVFALNRVAALYGVTLTGANLSWLALAALAGTLNGSMRIIAHINGNHFVVVTKVTANTITYIDMGKGKDKQNESVTVSKGEFLKVWKGDVSVGGGEAILISVLAQAEGYKTKFLSVEETKNIRGAFLPLLFVAIWGAIQAMGVAVWAILNAIGTLLAAVGQMVAGVIQNIGFALTKIGEGLSYVGHSLFNAVKFAASTIGKFFANPFASAAAQSAPAGVTQVSFGHALFQTAVKVGFGIATSKGLESLGVNPVVANLAAAFVTGGIHNGFAASFTAQNFIQGGVKNLALQASQTAFQGAGLSPTLQTTLGIIAGGFTDGIAQINIPGAFQATLTESLTKAATFYGLSELGDSLGIDTRISSAFALPILGFIDRSFDTGKIVGEDLVQSVVDSFSGAGLQFGLDFVVDEMDIDNPLLEALASTALTSTVSSLLNPNGNVFGDLLKSTEEATIKFLDEIQTTDFTQLVLQKGIVNALEDTATSVFSRQALEEIHSVGGIAQLISSRATNINVNGVTITEVRITEYERFYLDANGDLYAILKNGEYKQGQFHRTENNDVILVNGTVEKTLPDGQKAIIQVQNGVAMNVSYSIEGQPVIEIKINNEGEFNVDSFYEIQDGMVYLPQTDSEIEVTDGYITHIDFGNMPLPEGFDARDINFQDLTSQETAQLVQLVLLNGIRPGLAQMGTTPDYFDPSDPDSFVGALSDSGVSPSAVRVIPMFEQFGLAQDILNWFIDNIGLDQLTNKIIGNLNAIAANQSEPFVPLAYSGSGQPLLKALDTRTLNGSYYNVDTVILVGSPSNKTLIENPNIDTIINVYGNHDVFLEENISSIDVWGEILTQATRNELESLTQSLTLGTASFSKIQQDYTGVQTINIKLLGVNHLEYFKDPNKTYNGNELVLKSELFLARLAAFSESVNERDQFLDDFSQDENGVIVIDLNAWEPN